jgi:hypothetical protein
VFWIADGFEELGIAPGATDIFRRAAPARLDQVGIKNARLGIAEALDLVLGTDTIIDPPTRWRGEAIRSENRIER